jgi:hypothetical protein
MEIGTALVLLGGGVLLALALGGLLRPIATLAVIGGLVLIGLGWFAGRRERRR